MDLLLQFGLLPLQSISSTTNFQRKGRLSKKLAAEGSSLFKERKEKETSEST